MDYFSLCFDGFCLAGQSFLQLFFISRLTGKKQKRWHFAVYFLLICALEGIFSCFSLPGLLAIGAGAYALYGMSRFALGNRRAVSWIAAIFAVYISQLSYGIVNSVEAIVLPRLVGSWFLYLVLVLATLAVFAVCAGCYGAVLKFLSLAEDRQTPYIGLLLFPGLFFFVAEWYILRTSYSFSALPFGPSLTEAGKHAALLLLQILGLGALLCTLYAYQHLCHSFQAQAALKSLAQASQAQKVYIAEAQARYEQTRAFRHDIKNHLSVLEGLLSSGQLQEGRTYLQKLEIASSVLSFPYQTGNPVVDILLSEKLSLAEAGGIAAEVSLLLPTPCGIDDFDLCVIFANALDNALNACQTGGERKWIRIAGERQGDYYMLSFENTCPDAPPAPMGTGLCNIKAVAEKYHGAMLAEKAGGRFSLNVLLDVSLHSEDISVQKP